MTRNSESLSSLFQFHLDKYRHFLPLLTFGLIFHGNTTVNIAVLHTIPDELLK